MEKTVEIDILGVRYTVKTGCAVSEYETLTDSCGVCSPANRLILIADMSDVSGERTRERVERITLRHELLHAFLYECGLWADSDSSEHWAMNEEMVDWFALQYPKLHRLYAELGCDDE